MQLLVGVEVKSKTCKGPCGRMLPIDAFNRRRGTPDGRQYYCGDCSRVATKKGMQRLRRLESTVREKVRGRFDEWCADWIRRHPEEGNRDARSSA